KICFKRAFVLATIGYGTHALLDAATSYGTLLLWPFSNHRIAWSVISVVDPVFTLGVLIFTLFSFVKADRKFSRWSLIFIFSYLSLGVFQKMRVQNHVEKTANERGHIPSRTLIKPTVGNLILWKSVYEDNGYYYSDAHRVGLFSAHYLFSGDKIKKLRLKKRFPDLDTNSILYRDIQRFSHFSDGYIVIHPQYPDVIADLRYTLLPHRLDFLWGIEVHPRFPDRHADYHHFSSYSRDKKRQFFDMLWNSSN
ncbi:MAG: metal-dependent hydrolase, partial [Halobacteriovoraceae bacterium]|nr:metal-dependent hydrolase [Halobacteriovoraceae bacterium]